VRPCPAHPVLEADEHDGKADNTGPAGDGEAGSAACAGDGEAGGATSAGDKDAGSVSSVQQEGSRRISSARRLHQWCGPRERCGLGSLAGNEMVNGN
jgi:hypothetical protein